MSVIHISVPLIGHEKEHTALALALQLGEELGASVYASFLKTAFTLKEMEVRFQGMQRYDYYGYPDIINNFRDAFSRYETGSETHVKQRFNEMLKSLSAQGGRNAITWREDHAVTQTQDEYLQRLSILSDILVMSGVLRDEVDYENTLSRFLITSARPVIVVPSAHNREIQPLSASTILLAWEPTLSSIRAITMAMPLLLRARSVKIVTIGGKSGPVEQEELVAFLASHQVKASPVSATSANLSQEEHLLDVAEQEKADMMLMGGFSHSRLHDFVLGNMTEFVLKHAKIPVCFVH